MALGKTLTATLMETPKDQLTQHGKDRSMEPLFDLNAPKKLTSLSINSDLLRKYKAMNINLSVTLEEALTEVLANQNQEKWAKENKNAIRAYNDFVEENDNFGDEFREF